MNIKKTPNHRKGMVSRNDRIICYEKNQKSPFVVISTYDVKTYLIP
jgi:hypothetical protein